MQKLLILVFTLAFFGTTLSACVCGAHVGIDSVSYVFIGKVINIEPQPQKHYGTYLVVIDTIYKGNLNIGDTLILRYSSFNCMFIPTKNNTYFAFYTNQIEKESSISLCSQTVVVNKRKRKLYQPKKTETGF